METTQDKVVKMIMEAMDSEISENEIREDTNLFEDLEIDSVTILDIVSRVEEEWEISLTDYPELLDEMETVSTFVAFLEKISGGE
ncbi:phosphopantetheine-binding protein [Clostridium sp. AF37-5]|uniref:acyl carrier protein n=1 Tax=Clostridium sp. AF37-5 TaxID=2293016 RepID=UPI0015FA1F0F|nr:phosphopantetheine-binding protein [Clostridium sp. AF37-5]